MKHFALIKNFETNDVFAMVTKQDDTLSFHGYTPAGEQWARWASSNQEKALEDGLPPEVYFGKFQPMADNTEENVANTKFLAKSIVNEHESINPPGRSAEIRVYDIDSRKSIIDYKAVAFRADTKSLEVMAFSRKNYLAFDPHTALFKSAPLMESSPIHEIIVDKWKELPIRTFGKEIFEQKMLIIKNRREVNKENLIDIQEKGIGGGLRFIGGRFDPNAFDGDMDGLIQEGTAFQRPAPLRKPASNMSSSMGKNFARQGIMKRRGVDTSISRETGKVDKSPVGGGRFRKAGAEMAASSSRSSRSVKIGKQYKGIPGIDRASDSDGQIWESLSADEKTTIAARAAKLEQRRFNQLTGMTPGGRPQPFHRKYVARQNFERNRGGELDGLNGSLVEQMQTWVEDYVNNDSIPLKARLEVLRTYDDMLALYNMRTMKQDKPYEFLEHLHPAARASLFNDEKNDDGKVTSVSPKAKVSTVESTAFGRAGGYEKKSPVAKKPSGARSEVGDNREKPAKVDSSLRKFINRVMNPSPDKAAKPKKNN
jgi:hypothetical protein